MPDTPRSEAHRFLNEERGITDDTLAAFGVTYDGEWVVYPTGKKRKQDSTGKRTFIYDKGTTLTLLGAANLLRGATAFVCEGESDTLRLYQELGGTADCFGIPGIQTWVDEWAEQLTGYTNVFVILDNDQDYKVRAVVDRTWLAIRRAVGRNAKRLVLPESVKDVCEFFDSYNLDALRELSDRSNSPEGWHYKSLDLSKPATKPDWLVEDMIAKGDLTMMIGEPGVGKSWISMALAVAIANGSSSFLGRSLYTTASSRVLYVDEENPEVLVPFRLSKLGLTVGGRKNIRYLHQQGVRVDRHPDYLLEEALDYGPSLIVLDSLTRIHTKDENNAGEISALFNDGIIPLARETGATVLVLHHVNKTDAGSSFVRARGSSDLSGVIDAGIDVRGSKGNLTVCQYKSRWTESGAVIHVKIEDIDDGVVLTSSEPTVVF